MTFLEYPQAYFSYPLPLLFYMFTCKTVPPRRHFYSAFTVHFFFLSSFFALPLLLCIVSCSSLFSRFPCHCHRINLSQLTLTLPTSSILRCSKPNRTHITHPTHRPHFANLYNTKQPLNIKVKTRKITFALASPPLPVLTSLHYSVFFLSLPCPSASHSPATIVLVTLPSLVMVVSSFVVCV